MARHFTLNTGAEVPSVGYGTWQSKPDEVGRSVYTAVKVRTASCDLVSSANFFPLSNPGFSPLSNPDF
jgi:hypothetical protein